jgi:hypothetical protein
MSAFGGLSAAVAALLVAVIAHDDSGVPRAIIRAGALFGSSFIAIAVVSASVADRKK